MLSDKYRYDYVRRPVFDAYCDKSGLRYIARIHRFCPDPHVMFRDSDIEKHYDEELSYGPAILNQRAFYAGLAKFGKFAPKMQFPEYYRMAIEVMREHFSFLRGTSVWSIDDVIDRMKTNTSPGPALRHLYDNKGKAIEDERFWEMYDKFEESMFTLGGSVSYWGATCKEELRPTEKVQQEKTRVFMSGSLFMYIFMSRYCGAFNERFYDGFTHSCSAVGMSKFGGGFHLLYTALQYAQNCGFLDASGWDTCMFAMLLLDIAQFRFDCMSKGTVFDKIAFANIYQQVVESFLITPFGDVCQKTQGNPSGSSNTIVDNTLGNFVLKIYIWLRAVYPDSSLFPSSSEVLSEFLENVSMKLFGDDDIFSVSDVCKEKFNPKSMVELSRELGFTLTTTSEELMHRDNVDFLSHNVLLHNGFYVPYLSLEKLKATSVYSISNNVEIRAQRLVNLRYEGYFTPGWLPIIDNIIQEFQINHPYTKKYFNGVMSNSEIEYLYLPLESAKGKNRSRVLKELLEKVLVIDGESKKWGPQAPKSRSI